MIILSAIGDIWEKLPTHARIIASIAIIVGILVKPTILMIQWIRQIRKRKKIERDSNGLSPTNELYTPMIIKFSSHNKRIIWYREQLRNHNLQFQLNELIKYGLDTNMYKFGDPERTRLFRQLIRIYLGVLSDFIKRPLDSKIDLDKMSQKQTQEFFEDYIQNMSTILKKRFKDNFTEDFYNLVILDEDKGFVHFIDKHKNNFIKAVKDIITQDVKFYDSTNYRKLWEIYSLIRLLLNVGLELFMEFYDNFNGDLDDIISPRKKKKK